MLAGEARSCLRPHFVSRTAKFSGRNQTLRKPTAAFDGAAGYRLKMLQPPRGLGAEEYEREASSNRPPLAPRRLLRG
jgi:hypothetical protein